MLLVRKALTVHKIHNKYIHTEHRTILMPLMCNHYQSAMMRTNVLGDFVDKFTNDMTILSDIKNDSDDLDDCRTDCKYIAYVNCIIIVCILIYMFLDSSSDKK
jgi:hypothetical protein